MMTNDGLLPHPLRTHELIEALQEQVDTLNVMVVELLKRIEKLEG